MDSSRIIGATLIDPAEGGVVEDGHSRRFSAVRDELVRLADTPLRLPGTPAASDLLTRHEYAVARFRRNVEALLGRLEHLEQSVGRDGRGYDYSGEHDRRSR